MAGDPEHTVETRVSFSQRVRELMVSKGWYPARLAREVNKSQVTVDRWLSGTIPELDNLMMLARALDTTVDYLLHGSCGNNDTCVIWMSETDDNVQRERLQQALYVLKSNTEYATSLEMNIRSFYKSVKDNVEQRNEIIELKKQIVDLLAELKQHRAVIDASKQPAASIPPKSKPESNRET